MAEFLFNLQRFDSSGSGSSGSGSGGGSSSGGSNAKTDGNASVLTEVETWVDSFQLGNYSTLQVNTFKNEAYALRGLVSPDEYYSTTAADAFAVSGLNNNIIYDTDRFDNITFADTNLESLASFQYTALDSLGNGRYDLLFDTGTITSIYTHDNQFSPRLSFASGLSEIYSPMVSEWFTPDELQYSLNFMDGLNWYAGSDYYYYVNTNGVLVDSSDLEDAIPVEVDVYDLIPLSRAYNNVVTNVDWNDDIVLTDTRIYKNDISSINASEGTINILYNDGSGTVVKYDGTFSPRFYLSDYSNGFVYNSKMGGWRTIEQAWADAAQYEADAQAEAAQTAAYEANFNKVVNVNEKDANGNYLYPNPAFTISRFENTLVNDSNSRTDLYFYDSTYGNILSMLPIDDYHIDVTFDTGAIAEVEYTSIVSPIFHLADGTNTAYNWATSTFVDAYSGGNFYDEEAGLIQYTGQDNFYLSRAEDSFVNKVTSNDDIWLADTTVSNIAALDVINGYAISMTFDTGANLRVQDASYISPVFHFGDGTQMAYNWIDDQWGAAFDSTEGVAETFYVSSSDETFVRNADQIDNIYFTDANVGNIMDIHVDDNYINLRFDTGASTAVKYADYTSPEFTFANGEQYYYDLDVDEEGNITGGAWKTPAQILASSADLLDDPVVATASADATLSDIVSAPVAVDFGAESAFDINSAGGVVAPTAVAYSEQKDA